MSNLMRRVRGAIGLGLTWAIGWVPIGAITAFVLGLTPHAEPGIGVFVLAGATLFGVLGFLAGGIFSGVLRVTEGRRTFEELKLLRFTAWGGVAGLLLGGTASLIGAVAGVTLFGGPGFQPLDAVVAGVTTLLGASSAAGTLLLARNAETPAGVRRH